MKTSAVATFRWLRTGEEAFSAMLAAIEAACLRSRELGAASA